MAGAVLLAYLGDLRGAVAGLCIAAGAVLLATWARSSAFPGRQWVVLGLSLGGFVVGMARLPADVLRQEVNEGSPSNLLRAHERALELLADRGLVPARFRDDAEVLESARELELRALRAFTDSSLTSLFRIETRGQVGDPVLADDDRSRFRIEAWLGTEPA